MASAAIPSFLGPLERINLAPRRWLGINWAGAAPGGKLEPPLSLEKQSQTEWCWAAVGAAVHRYLGDGALSQCDVACRVRNRDDCCAHPSSTLCNSPSSLATTLTRLQNLAGSSPNGRATPAEIQREIGNDKPVCCGLTNGRLGHFVIITGWYRSGVETGLVVKDPALGNGEKRLLYRQLTSGYPQSGWQWRETYFTR